MAIETATTRRPRTTVFWRSKEHLVASDTVSRDHVSAGVDQKVRLKYPERQDGPSTANGPLGRSLTDARRPKKLLSFSTGACGAVEDGE